MSAPLEKNRRMSTPLEMSTVTSHGGEAADGTAPEEKRWSLDSGGGGRDERATRDEQHVEHATGDEHRDEPWRGEAADEAARKEERCGASTAAAAVAMSTPLKMSSTVKHATRDEHHDEPRRGKAAEETAR